MRINVILPVPFSPFEEYRNMAVAALFPLHQQAQYMLNKLTKHDNDLGVGELSLVDVWDESLNGRAGHLRAAQGLVRVTCRGS